jgi:Zonula occludens toxin
MITLITGVPGGGKSLYCVWEILKKLDDDNKKGLDEGKEPRPIYVDGIPELLIPHEVMDGSKWYEEMPDGALGVIDEVQRVWRPAGSGKQLPDSIALLETHRHRGIDLVIMTQHPMLMHVNVRNLVGKHIHLRRTPLGVYAYEWSECVNPTSAFKTALVKTKWPHPKKAFGLYKSAEIHNKVKFRIPKAVWALGFAVVAIVGFGSAFVRSVKSRMDGHIAGAPTVQTQTSVPSGGYQNRPPSSSSDNAKNSEEQKARQAIIDDPVKAFRPRFVGMPESAPAYDGIRTVKSMPRLAGCIADDSHCECYTEQGTSIAIPLNECKQKLQGMGYDAFRDNAKAGAEGGVIQTAAR